MENSLGMLVDLQEHVVEWFPVLHDVIGIDI